MANVVKAAILQAKWTGDTASMIDVHEGYARTAAQQGAKIMGFQEVFNAPYFCQVQETEHYRWAEPVPDGPDGARMQALARETGMVLVVPVFEVESAGNYYNTAAVIDADGTVLGKYRKHHIPQVKGFWEKYYFKPGNLGLAGVRDRRRHGRRLHLLRPALPRGLARARAWPGAQIVFNPSATSRGAVVVPVEAGAAGRRGGQRVLRRRDQPGRRRGVRRQRLLRHQLLRRPARPVRRRRRERRTTRSCWSATWTST